MFLYIQDPYGNKIIEKGDKRVSMETEGKSRKCLYCGNYEGYYKKGLHHFESIKQGYCSELKKIVSNKDGCMCWRSSRYRCGLRKRVATRALYEILTQISAIRQIFEESEEERKNL